MAVREDQEKYFCEQIETAKKMLHRGQFIIHKEVFKWLRRCSEGAV